MIDNTNYYLGNLELLKNKGIIIQDNDLLIISEVWNIKAILFYFWLMSKSI